MKRIPLEKDIENAFLRKLKEAFPQFKSRKLNGAGFRGWPDRLIIGPKGFTCWIEFKRPLTGELSKGQEILFQEFEEMGHTVHVIYRADEAIRLLECLWERHNAEVGTRGVSDPSG